jgi:hypothetical protein
MRSYNEGFTRMAAGQLDLAAALVDEADLRESGLRQTASSQSAASTPESAPTPPNRLTDHPRRHRPGPRRSHSPRFGSTVSAEMGARRRAGSR